MYDDKMSINLLEILNALVYYIISYNSLEYD